MVMHTDVINAITSCSGPQVNETLSSETGMQIPLVLTWENRGLEERTSEQHWLIVSPECVMVTE
jgi:hypothetical protein